jgi:hypothetical protein
LYAVTARAANDVWAVGSACTDSGCDHSNNLVEHWNGTAWTEVASPSPGNGANTLYSVAAISSTDAWAVGSACPDSLCDTATGRTLHWDGTAWSSVSSPDPGSTATYLNAVAMAAGNDVWAVGSASNDGTTYFNPVLHWNGSAWATVSVPNPGDSDNTLRALARIDATNVWTVGTFQNSGEAAHTQIQQYSDAPCVTPTSTPTRTATATATSEPPTATATSAPPTVTATGTPGPVCEGWFGDVAPTDYFFEAVRYLACHNVIGGYADGTFRPYNETTRGQMAKIVTLGLGLPAQTPTSGQTFADVAPGDTFFAYVETLVAQGIAGGYSCGGVNPDTGSAEPCIGPTNRPYFRPANRITRGQLVKFVALAAVPQRGWSLLNPATPTFGDVPAGSTFYPYVETAVAHGVINGYADGTFRPTAFAFRGQIAKIVYLAATGP